MNRIEQILSVTQQACWHERGHGAARDLPIEWVTWAQGVNRRAELGEDVALALRVDLTNTNHVVE